MNYFWKKLLGHEIFSTMVSWAMNVFETFVEPSGPLSYILNVRFVKGTSTDI